MLSGLLPLTPTQFRLGRSADGTRQYMARILPPTAISVAFVPWVATSPREARRCCRHHFPGRARSRNMLVSAARRWTTSFPDNPESFEALAAGLEHAESWERRDSADGALRQARSLARTPTTATSAAAHVQFAQTRRGAALDLADSQLWPPTTTRPVARRAGRGWSRGPPGRVAGNELRTIALTSQNAAGGISAAADVVIEPVFARAAPVYVTTLCSFCGGSSTRC
jgi:hypothetical protein